MPKGRTQEQVVQAEIIDLLVAETTVPTFQGIGDLPEGYGRTRLLRALLEMEPPALAAGLRVPWEENPQLRSDLLGAP